MGHPGQMLSLGELELPPILSPSIHTNAPGPTITEYQNNSLSKSLQKCIYLYSNLIWSIAQPLLAVIFVTQYLFCVSSCPSSISCFVTSSMATPCSIFSYKLTKSPFLLTEWAIYLSAGINSYESTAHKRVNSTLEGNHPAPQETRREENSKGTHLKFLLYF